MRAGAANLFADVLESLDPERLGTQVRAGLAHQLEKVELAPLLGQMLTAMIADRRHVPLIDGAIRWAGHALEANEDLVRAMISERADAYSSSPRSLASWPPLTFRSTSLSIASAVLRKICRCSPFSTVIASWDLPCAVSASTCLCSSL